MISTVLAVINKRYGGSVVQKNDDEFDDLEEDGRKKRLLPRPDHSNIFLPGSHPEDKFFGDLAEGERKTQKEIWEVKTNYYKK